MKVLEENHRKVEERNVTSILEVYDIAKKERRVICEFDGLIEAPNWHRNGKELIYNRGGCLYRLMMESGDIIPIDSGFCCQCNNDHVLSPEGERIAVSHHTWEDAESRIYILNLKGGPARLITPIAPSYLHGWSPDGKNLVYCAERNEEYDIYTIPEEGGIERRLTFSKGLNDGPEYTPDGQSIWFNSVRSGLMQIWKMDADGKNQRQMTDTPSNNWFPHISPDGKKVLYMAYNKEEVMPEDHPENKNVEIHLMDIDGNEDTVIVELFGGQGTINVNSWSPDSDRFAFVSYRMK